jgi:HPt (histidine-containing phosphotransfer) domain-containing protein
MIAPDDGDAPNLQEDEDLGLAELIPQYLALCQRDLMRLKAALEASEWNSVRVLGHNLKGSGGAYGFPELTEIGASIETSAKEQNSSAAREGIDRLTHFLNQHPPSM